MNLLKLTTLGIFALHLTPSTADAMQTMRGLSKKGLHPVMTHHHQRWNHLSTPPKAIHGQWCSMGSKTEPKNMVSPDKDITPIVKLESKLNLAFEEMYKLHLNLYLSRGVMKNVFEKLNNDLIAKDDELEEFQKSFLSYYGGRTPEEVFEISSISSGWLNILIAQKDPQINQIILEFMAARSTPLFNQLLLESEPDLMLIKGTNQSTLLPDAQKHGNDDLVQKLCTRDLK